MPFFDRAMPLPGATQERVTLLPFGFTGSPNDGHLVVLKNPDGTDQLEERTGKPLTVIEPGLSPDNPIRVEAEEFLEAQKIVQAQRAAKAAKPEKAK